MGSGVGGAGVGGEVGGVGGAGVGESVIIRTPAGSGVGTAPCALGVVGAVDAAIVAAALVGCGGGGGSGGSVVCGGCGTSSSQPSVCRGFALRCISTVDGVGGADSKTADVPASMSSSPSNTGRSRRGWCDGVGGGVGTK